MPIDYEALIAPFRTAYFLQRRSINESLRRIAEWLTKRLTETRGRELATRGFQVFYFSGGALAVWIDTSQHGVLGPGGEPPATGFWQNAAAPFVALWNGLLLAPTMIKAEKVLPALLDTLAQTVKMIVDSLDRFKKPDQSLFDATVRKSWQDLFGMVGLFFRLVNDPRTLEQIKTFSAGGIEMIGVLRTHFPANPQGKQEAGGGLADLARWIVGGIVAVPLVGQLLAQIGRTADKVIRLKVLDWATEIQSEVFALRLAAIDFLYVTLFNIGRLGLEWLMMLQSDVVSTLDLYLRFVQLYVGELKTWLETTGTELKTFADGLVGFLYGLMNYLEPLVDVDFGDAMNPLPKSVFDFSFRLGDILEWRNNPSKAVELQRKIDELREDRPLLTALLKDRLLALREVIGIGATQTVFPTEAAPPELKSLAAPNIYEAFFGRPGEPTPGVVALRGALANAGPALKDNLGKIFDEGVTKLTDLATTMSKAATGAARLGSAARYKQVADRASELAETAFGANAMRAALVPRKDPIAEAFESWLVSSGFDLIGKALPRYVAEMIEFWQQEASKPPSERPTSPHILARRPQVGHVRMPRMVIRVNDERELDKVLAAEVADRARVGVSQAFQRAIAQYGLAQ